LERSPITGVGLNHLKQLNGLKELTIITSNRLEQTAVDELRVALPNVKIHIGS
jgi:hypothetical protein